MDHGIATVAGQEPAPAGFMVSRLEQAGIAIFPLLAGDCAYVLDHLRRHDARELRAALGPHVARDYAVAGFMEAAAAAWSSGSVVENATGAPVLIWGVTPAYPGARRGAAFAMGTARFTARMAEALAAWFLEFVEPHLRVLGVRRIEARALADHGAAIAWMKSLGAAKECHLHHYGHDGEDFVQMVWL